MDTSSSLKNTTIIEGKIYTNNNNDSKDDSDTTITNPQETDVLCGLGAVIIRHPGNLAFRRLVDEYKERYTICLNRKKKKCISESIVKIIRKQNGRFLARSTNRNFWMDIGDKKAIAKTSQRLREGQAQQIMVNKFTTNNTCSQTLREDQSKQKTLSDQLVGTSGPLVQQQQQYGNEPQSQSRQLQSASSSSWRLNININPAPAPAPLQEEGVCLERRVEELESSLKPQSSSANATIRKRKRGTTATTDTGIIPYVATSSNIATERKRRRDYDTTSNDNKKAYRETVYEDDDHNGVDDYDHDEDDDDEGILASSSSEKKMRHISCNYYGNNNITKVDNITTTAAVSVANNETHEERQIRLKAEARAYALNDTSTSTSLTPVALPTLSPMIQRRANSVVPQDQPRGPGQSPASKSRNRSKSTSGIRNGSGVASSSASSSSVLATAKNKFDIRWMEIYQRLVAYKKQHNDSTKVPQNYEKDPQLAMWVKRQRKANNNNKLMHDRYSLLDSLDFDWGNGPQGPRSNWMGMYQRLVAFKKEHDDSTTVPRSYEKDPKLGSWVGTQRRLNNNKTLLYDRHSLLDSIDFDWGYGPRVSNTD